MQDNDVSQFVSEQQRQRQDPDNQSNHHNTVPRKTNHQSSTIAYDQIIKNNNHLVHYDVPIPLEVSYIHAYIQDGKTFRELFAPENGRRHLQNNVILHQSINHRLNQSEVPHPHHVVVAHH